MKLINFQVNYYKCINDSELITISDIACFVGNNNSGKTALFEALHKLNPAFVNNKQFEIDDFPKDKQEFQNSKTKVITSTFKLNEAEINFLNKKFGESCLKSNTIQVSKDYSNTFHWDFDVNEAGYMKHLIGKKNLTEVFKDHMDKIESTKNCFDIAKSLPQLSTNLSGFVTQLELLQMRSMKEEVIEGYLQLWLPKFLYISEINTLPSYFSLKQITKALSSSENVKEKARTALAFLKLLGIDINKLLNEPNNETLRKTLNQLSQKLSNQLASTLKVFENHLIDIDIQSLVAQDVRIDSTIYINILDKLNNLSIPIGKQSGSLLYFLSFLCSLAIIKDKIEPFIIIIDSAINQFSIQTQEDFKKYLHENLAGKHQVLYSTHSPFMINTQTKDKIFSVEAKGKYGTKISKDLNSNPWIKKIIDIADNYNNG